MEGDTSSRRIHYNPIKALAEMAKGEAQKADAWSAERMEQFLREFDSERYMSMIFVPPSTE
jgi:hypothetical protein